MISIKILHDLVGSKLKRPLSPKRRVRLSVGFWIATYLVGLAQVAFSRDTASENPLLVLSTSLSALANPFVLFFLALYLSIEALRSFPLTLWYNTVNIFGWMNYWQLLQVYKTQWFFGFGVIYWMVVVAAQWCFLRTGKLLWLLALVLIVSTSSYGCSEVVKEVVHKTESWG